MSDQQEPYILGLDDDPDFNALLKVVLKKGGHKLVTTTDPKDFAQKLKANPPKLCLIDINLNEGFGAGFTLVQAIRNTMGFDLPLIIISRRSTPEDISRALELGANDFVPKPLDDTYLLQKISHFLENQDYKPLPYFAVSQKDWNCEISLDINISQVNEFGLTLASKHFLSKGTYIELTGAFIKELTGKEAPLKTTVNNSWMDEHTHEFRAFCEFNAEDQILTSSVRSYLLNNAPHEEETDDEDWSTD